MRASLSPCLLCAARTCRQSQTKREAGTALCVQLVKIKLLCSLPILSLTLAATSVDAHVEDSNCANLL